MGTNSSGTRRLDFQHIRTFYDNTFQTCVGFGFNDFGNLIENNIFAGTESGGIGTINMGSVSFVPTEPQAGIRNTYRNNRIGIGPNGENIGPPAGKFSVGIYASTGDMVEGNTIANFDGSGILVRDSVGNSAEPAQIRNNMISNCGMGVQAAWTKTALVENNQLTNCKAGVVVNQALLDWTTGERTRVENPFKIVPTVGVTVTQNRYANVTGPKIALTENAGAVFGDGYTPNLRTVPGEGPNHFQPTPTMATATRAASGVVTVTGTTVGAGTLDLAAVTASTVTPVLTAQVSGGPYSVQIPADKAVGLQQVSATVTVNGDTSE
ncbi:MAG: right-handed parallel beta-helix repeat-containing protein, partial [Blastocatellia bacterium]|nr:right-handed parallel beta-helix repeat-containing protein [Blastocatellia bacterium]